MLKLMGKEINANLGAQTVLFWTRVQMVKGSNYNKKMLTKNLCYTEVCYNGTAHTFYCLCIYFISENVNLEIFGRILFSPIA